MFDRFLSVFSLVSRIPVKFRFRFDLSRIDFYLPLVGICPAALSLLTYTAALSLMGMELFSAAAALLAEYLCFNLFRLDGLADTADAFLGRFDREKRLAILKDSRTGGYGLFAGIAAPAVKFCLLCGLLKGGGWARGGVEAWGGVQTDGRGLTDGRGDRNGRGALPFLYCGIFRSIVQRGLVIKKINCYSEFVEVIFLCRFAKKMRRGT